MLTLPAAISRKVAGDRHSLTRLGMPARRKRGTRKDVIVQTTANVARVLRQNAAIYQVRALIDATPDFVPVLV